MPIMAAHSRSDARGTARLLANMAIASINNPKRGEPQEVALNNVYRLLQSFRRDAFFGHEASVAHRSQSADEKLTSRPPVERNVREVRLALDRAINIVFPTIRKDDAIEAVERVLRSTAYPKSQDPSSDEDRKQVVTFFKILVESL